MNHMVQAGRLQPVPRHPSLVRMGGVMRHTEDEAAALQTLSAGDTDTDILNSEGHTQLLSEKVRHTANSVPSCTFVDITN